MSSPQIDLVSYLIKYGRRCNFDTANPTPQKGRLMYNTADGKIYFGDRDGGWKLYSSPSPTLICSRTVDKATL